MDFVNEGKLDEERKRRQAEWERVRRPEDPKEAPADVFDNRTLYEKLKEQNDLKKREFEEQFALKNQIKGLDSDEAQFLSEIDRVRSERERKARLEEKKEIEEVKKAKVGALSSIASDIPKITLSLPSHRKENKQAELLSNIVVKRKSNGNSSGTTSAKTLISSTDTSFNKITHTDSEDSDDENKKRSKKLKSKSSNKNQIVLGVLPGIGDYDSNSSSLSDDSSDEDNDNEEDDIDTSNLLTRSSCKGSAASKLG